MKLTKFAIVFLLIGLALPQRSESRLVTYEFAGHIAHAYGDGNGYGLGIVPGDAFSGSFSYDLNADPLSFDALNATYTVVSFDVKFPFASFIAQNLNMRVQLFDSHITWVNVEGTILGGLFMNVGFTNGEPLLADTSPPDNLSCIYWFLCAFKISDTGSPAIEMLSAPIESINAGTSHWGDSPYDFRVAKVPEPSSVLLFGIGLAVILVYGWRKASK